MDKAIPPTQTISKDSESNETPHSSSSFSFAEVNCFDFAGYFRSMCLSRLNLAIESPQNLKRSHIAFVPFPFGGHVSIFSRLVRHLADVAPEAVFSLLSTPGSLPSLQSSQNPKNLHFIEISDGIGSEQVPQNVAMDLFFKSALESVRVGLEAAEKAGGAKLTCIVTDAMMWRAGDIAESRALPWIAFWTSSPQLLMAHMHAHEIRSTIQDEDQGSVSSKNKMLDFIPCLSKYSVSQLPEGIMDGDYSKFSIELQAMEVALFRAKGVVVSTINNCDKEMHSIFSWRFMNYYPIGPIDLLFPTKDNNMNILEAHHHDCITWLDKQDAESVIYIAFDTFAPPPPSDIITLAEGLDESNALFLWSLTEEARSVLPPGFVDRVEQTGRALLVTWAPHLKVLEHAAVGLFFSDGGWSSIQQSIIFGLPMICRPVFGDQLFNTRVISHELEMGVELEKGVFTKEEVVHAFREILEGEEGVRMRERAKNFKKFAFDELDLNGGFTNKNFEELVNKFFKC